MRQRRPSRRPWHHNSRQHVLLEYANLTDACPEGIYLSLTPGNAADWSGVLFVRKGPYAPAILRFLVSFPSVYPESPPSITLVTDIFHPLVTPLTTYTYTNGSLSADTVSAADEERLPPGGFGLSDGFPHWFGRPEQSAPSLGNMSGNVSGSYDEDDTPNRGTSPSQYTGRRPPWGHDESRPSIIDVLDYVKRAFGDEGVLDRLPFEAAVNPGAWKAWRAHRRDVVQDAGNSGSPHDRLSAERRHESRHTTPREIKRPDEWSWDGVWKERVKKGVEASMSNHVLFGPGGDDIINFTDTEDDAVSELKNTICSSASEGQ